MLIYEIISVQNSVAPTDKKNRNDEVPPKFSATSRSKK